jgi:ABC-type nitrate/sulfonate/bicarbonate transport system permease component
MGQMMVNVMAMDEVMAVVIVVGVTQITIDYLMRLVRYISLYY